MPVRRPSGPRGRRRRLVRRQRKPLTCSWATPIMTTPSSDLNRRICSQAMSSFLWRFSKVTIGTCFRFANAWMAITKRSEICLSNTGDRTGLLPVHAEVPVEVLGSLERGHVPVEVDAIEAVEVEGDVVAK